GMVSKIMTAYTQRDKTASSQSKIALDLKKKLSERDRLVLQRIAMPKK
ncbi:hypothetical protein TNCV_4559661, partial [Trichonephila clavipes]